MTNDSLRNICNLWQQGSGEPPRFTPDDLRRRLTRFERTIRLRNLREYIAAAFVTGVFFWYSFVFPTLLLRIACGLLIAGTAYVAYQLHRRAASVSVPADLGLQNCLVFQRSEFERQRNALNTVWSWYLLPFLPGMALFIIGLFQFTKRMIEAAGKPFHTGAAVAGFSIVAAGIAIVFIAIWLLNRRAAKKLQVHIDELDRLARDSA